MKNGGDISKVNPIEVGVAGVTGALGPGGGFWWNTSVNAAGGFVQTELNNVINHKNDNVFVNTATSALTGAAGFSFGDKTLSASSLLLPKSLVPVILGNVFGAVVTERANVEIDHLQKSTEVKAGEGR